MRFCAPGVQNTVTHGRDVDIYLRPLGTLQQMYRLSRPLTLAETLRAMSLDRPVQGIMVLSDVRRGW